MAGTLIVSNLTTDTDNTFIVRSNTGTTLFIANTTGIDVANSIAATSITSDKILSVANTKITGLLSNASAIVEKVDTYYDKVQIIYELKLSNVSKEFLNAKEEDKLFKKLKDKTLEFRYVKLTVALDVVDKISGEEKPENFVKSYRHSLTKTFDSQKEKNDKLMFENKSLKCGSKGKKKFCKTI